MQTPSLNHFETFLCVAEQASFTKAAQQLGISKAAVSNTIRLLETSMQVPLFIRDTRNIRLSEEGEVLFIQCQRLKDELDSARNAISGFKQEPAGTLKISANPYYGEIELLEILQEYLRKFPKMNVEVVSDERMPDMAREHIDIVFGVNWPAPLDVVAKKIGNTRYVLCASPKYFKKNGTPTKLSELERHNYIPHLGRSKDNIIANLKHQQTLKLKTPLKLNSAELMIKAALNNMGIIQLHDYMVRDELSKGRLVEVLQDTLKPDIPIYMYYQKHRFVQPKIRQFINILQKKIK